MLWSALPGAARRILPGGAAAPASRRGGSRHLLDGRHRQGARTLEYMTHDTPPTVPPAAKPTDDSPFRASSAERLVGLGLARGLAILVIARGARGPRAVGGRPHPAPRTGQDRRRRRRPCGDRIRRVLAGPAPGAGRADRRERGHGKAARPHRHGGTTPSATNPCRAGLPGNWWPPRTARRPGPLWATPVPWRPWPPACSPPPASRVRGGWAPRDIHQPTV